MAAQQQTPAADPKLLSEILRLRQQLRAVATQLGGDRTRRARQEPTPPSINDRIRSVVGSQWNVTSSPTQTQRDSYRHAAQEFTRALADLRRLIRKDLAKLNDQLEAAGAPWTPGRLPTWKMEK